MSAAVYVMVKSRSGRAHMANGDGWPACGAPLHRDYQRRWITKDSEPSRRLCSKCYTTSPWIEEEQ